MGQRADIGGHVVPHQSAVMAVTVLESNWSKRCVEMTCCVDGLTKLRRVGLRRVRRDSR